MTPDRRDPDDADAADAPDLPEPPPGSGPRDDDGGDGRDGRGLQGDGGPDRDARAAGQGPRDDSEIDAEFERIVAGWDTTGESRWRHEAPPRAEPDPEPEPAEEPEPSEVLAAHDAAELDEENDHYVPPEPPPFPRPTPAILGAAALVVLGIVLIAWPSLIGLSTRYGLPLGLISFSGAVVWLIAHLRQGPPDDSGWHDGAQV